MRTESGEFHAPIFPDRIVPDRIDKTGTGLVTPDKALKFCAFLSCVVVSSFIETRRNVFFFFPKVITDSDWNSERYDMTN